MQLPLRTGRPWLLALVLVTGVGPLATDTYLASLPQVQATLGTSSTVVQLTMTFFIAGMAVGQLLAGPVSDGHGRRRMVLAGAATFTIVSLLCAFAPTGWTLVAERGVQGLVAGVGVAVGRAVVSDRYAGSRAAAMYGTLASFSLIGPVVAPAIGSALLAVGDWRTVFLFLGGLGVLMTAAAAVGIPETLPVERRQATGLRDVGARMHDLMTDRVFMAPVLVQCLVVAGFFVYIGGSSIVLQAQLGLTPGHYALVFASNALVMVAASVTFRVLVVHTGAAVLRRVALAVATSAGAALFLVCLLTPDHTPPLPLVWAPLAVMLGGLGMFLPASTAIVQAAGRRSAGTASALGGGVPFFVGALTTPLTGLLGSQTVMTMASGTFFFYVLALVAAWRFRHLAAEDRAARDVPLPTPELVGRP
jgi:DHA1 family bicyclomycin/chloramphenicol resistance-like MFS transporter